jgi:hypothetical protein
MPIVFGHGFNSATLMDRIDDARIYSHASDHLVAHVVENAFEVKRLADRESDLIQDGSFLYCCSSRLDIVSCSCMYIQ